MDKCRFLKKLSSYLDNQLSDAGRTGMENHLRGCKVCSGELAKLKLISEKLKAWQAPDPGLGFEDKVRNEIVLGELERSDAKMKKKTLAILIPSGALAGILLVAFWGVLSNSGKSLRVDKKSDIRGRTYQSVRSNIGIPKGKIGDSTEAVGTKYSRDMRGYNDSEDSFLKRESNFHFESRKDILSSTEGRFKNGVVEGGEYWSSFSAKPREADDKSLVSSVPVTPAVSAEGSVIVVHPAIPAVGGEEDRIIRTGDINLETDDGSETYEKALAVCNELGGYIAGSDFHKTKDGKESGMIIMRIPKDKFTTALDKLSALGKVESINTDSQDVSQEYSNLKSQLDAALVVYNKMLEALQKRNVAIPEAVRLESELTPVLRRVEDLKNKIEYLDKSVAYTTINFYFYESEVSFKTLKESRKFIQESMIDAAIKAIKFAAAAIPVLIVAMILCGIALFLGLVIRSWIKKLLKRG